MADYSIATQVQPFQAPNLLALAAQGQQMQTNALKAQLLQQEAAREGQLRQLYATPGFDLSSPEGIRQVGSLGGPEMAQKAALTATQMRKAQAELSGEERKLVAEQGAEFRNLLTGLVSMSQSDPQRAAEVYSDVYAKLPEGIKQRYSPTFDARTAVQALRTTDQLLALYAPAKPETREFAGTLGQYDPATNTLKEATVVPAGAPAGVASFPMRPAAAADMAQRGQRYAPDLMVDAAPANAMAPAAAPSPYGGLNAMAAPQAGAGIPASQLAQQQKDAEAQRQLGKVGRETLERERAQAAVKTEEKQREENLAKQKVTGTLKGIVDAYKGLASRGELIRASGDQSLTERAGIGVKAAIPSALTTVISPKTGADIATIENLRRDLIPTITALTGAKSIDAVAELTSVLNSLSSPGQTDTAIVKTLNNFGEKYGLGTLLSMEDLAPAKPGKASEVPAGRKAAAPTSNLSSMDQQALDWAKSNPNDPRASAIKERLGVR